MMMFKMLEEGGYIYMYICCVLGNKKKEKEIENIMKVLII